VRLYERLFGPYPYPELTIVAAPLPGRGQGVVYSGLIFLSETLYRSPGRTQNLLARRLARSPAMRVLLEFVLAHEIAHQWWGTVVVSNRLRHPVLDEALAQYAAALYFRYRYGSRRARWIRQTQLAINYHFYRILGGKDTRAHRSLRAFRDHYQYTALVYGKAPFFYHALRRVLGPRAFVALLRRYYRAYRFRQATPKALPRLAAQQHPKKRKKIWSIYRRWWYQRHGDRDLGRPSLPALLQKLLGGKLNPSTRRALRMLQPMLRLMLNRSRRRPTTRQTPRRTTTPQRQSPRQRAPRPSKP